MSVLECIVTPFLCSSPVHCLMNTIAKCEVFSVYFICVCLHFILWEKWISSFHTIDKKKRQVSSSIHFLCWHRPTNLQRCANRQNRERRGSERGTFKFQRGFQNSFPSPPSQQCVGENHSFCLIVKGAVSTPAARSNVAILSVLYSRRTDWMKWIGGGHVFDVGLVNSIQWWNPNIFVYT